MALATAVGLSPLSQPLELKLLIDKYSVIRFDPSCFSPSCLSTVFSSSSTSSSVSPHSALVNLVITPTEISLVSPTLTFFDRDGRLRDSDMNPQAVESGWLALRVEPPETSGHSSLEKEKTELPPGIDFGVVGIMARISGVLAKAEISLFAVSTFDTDYILVKEEIVAVAVKALREDGCRVQLEEPESSLWTDLQLSNNADAV